MNNRIRELIAQATKVVEPNDPDYRHEIFDKEKFAELIVRETIDVMIGQLWNYGIDESNNPSFYKAVERTKEHFGVEE